MTSSSNDPASDGMDKYEGLHPAVAGLLNILDLEPLEHNLFRGRSPKTGWQRVFGGQVIGQALVAAQRTVPSERQVHSLHGYFMRPGDPAVPIIYEVDRIRDGGSFTTRRVVAIQHGKAIFSMSASFQIDEDGLDYFMPMPEQPDPETLMSQKELQEKFSDIAPETIKSYWRRERPIEMRATSYEHFISDKKLPPEQYVWMKAIDTIPDEPGLQAAILAYASDMTLLDTSLYPHGRKIFEPDMQVASLDHAMWFHRPINMNEWLLFAQDTPNSSGARGFNRGSLYTRDGMLVASCVQEGLIRIRDPKRNA